MTNAKVTPYRGKKCGSNDAETLAYLRDGTERPFDAEDRVFCMRMLRKIAGEIIAGEEVLRVGEKS